MDAYQNLSSSYDGLTGDVPYAEILNFMETVLREKGLRPQRVLDLACGTGSMSVLLANHGYEVTASDISEEMLTQAMQKCMFLDKPPMFIHQAMQKTRLPMPVDLVVSFLDSINYLDEPEDCRKTFERVSNALTDEGAFFFDINSPYKFSQMDGQVFLDENESSYCVWRAELDREENRMYYGIDLFQKTGEYWKKSFEQHCEYVYEPSTLISWLKEAGFTTVELFGDRKLMQPAEDEMRIYILAMKGKQINE